MPPRSSRRGEITMAEILFRPYSSADTACWNWKHVKRYQDALKFSPRDYYPHKSPLITNISTTIPAMAFNV